MRADKKILYPALFLIGAGVIFINSAVSPYEPNDRIYKHLMFALLSVVIIFSGYTYNIYKIDRKWLYMYAGICAVIMALVILSPFGVTMNNSRRWLELGPLRFQPSELAKPAIFILIAAFFDDMRKNKRLIIAGLAYFILLLFFQPDIGQAMLFVICATLTMLICGLIRNKKTIAYCAICAVMLLAAGSMLFSHVRNRLGNYAGYLIDPLDSQYQIRQSVIAVSTGSPLGVGIGNSVQKLSLLPEASNDFIFAIILEEIGIIGLASILSAVSIITLTALRAASVCQDPFCRAMITGFAVVFLVQSAINIMVNLALLPAKGINLPLVSYGGTSMIVFAAMISAMISAAANQNDLQTAYSIIDS